MTEAASCKHPDFAALVQSICWTEKYADGIRNRLSELRKKHLVNSYGKHGLVHAH